MRTRYRKILVSAALTALALTAIFASAANAAEPNPVYKDFAGCPSKAENARISFCEKFEFTGGHISFGRRDIPVTNPIVVSGGVETKTGNFDFNENGGMIPVAQPVPGGVIGMTGLNWLDALSSKALKLNAVVELAGQPGSLFASAWSLPVKIHLESPVLGKGCYLGSDAAPIELNLTTGTTAPPLPNVPISGHLGSPSAPEAERPEVEVSTGGLFVDNAYAVPAATGCQLEVGSFVLPIDSLVNAGYHLPAAAGTNETMLEFSDSFVSPKVVYSAS